MKKLLELHPEAFREPQEAVRVNEKISGILLDLLKLEKRSIIAPIATFRSRVGGRLSKLEEHKTKSLGEPRRVSLLEKRVEELEEAQVVTNEQIRKDDQLGRIKGLESMRIEVEAMREQLARSEHRALAATKWCESIERRLDAQLAMIDQHFGRIVGVEDRLDALEAEREAWFSRDDAEDDAPAQEVYGNLESRIMTLESALRGVL